jgi:hypothetical protein
MKPLLVVSALVFCFSNPLQGYAQIGPPVYRVSLNAGANISEFDPAPDIQFFQSFSPLDEVVELPAQRSTTDGIATASVSAGKSNVIRAFASASTNVEDFTQGGPLASGASVEIVDTLYYLRSLSAVMRGAIRIGIHFNGTVHQTADASVLAQVTLDGSNAGSVTDEFPYQSFISLNYSDRDSEIVAFPGTIRRNASIDIPILLLRQSGIDGLHSGLTLEYSLTVGAGGGGEISSATADFTRSATFRVEYYDENGELDPSVTFSAASGIDYTAVPEPNAFALSGLAITCLGALFMRRRYHRAA